MTRFAIFVHDPDGDSGFGRIVGPYRSAATAERKAEAIERAAERAERFIECIVLPVCPGQLGAAAVLNEVIA